MCKGLLFMCKAVKKQTFIKRKLVLSLMEENSQQVKALSDIVSQEYSSGVELPKLKRLAAQRYLEGLDFYFGNTRIGVKNTFSKGVSFKRNSKERRKLKRAPFGPVTEARLIPEYDRADLERELSEYEETGHLTAKAKLPVVEMIGKQLSNRKLPLNLLDMARIISVRSFRLAFNHVRDKGRFIQINVNTQLTRATINPSSNTYSLRGAIQNYGW